MAKILLIVVVFVIRGIALGGDSRALTAVRRMELGQAGRGALSPLSAEDAPELTRLLRTVKDRLTFKAVANRLRELKFVASIPVLVECLDRQFPRRSVVYDDPAETELGLWGFDAIHPLIRGVGSTKPRIRAGCLHLLEQLAAFPSGRRYTYPVFRDLARTGNTAEKRLALSALWEMVHPSDYDKTTSSYVASPIADKSAFASIIDLAFDSTYAISQDAKSGLMWMILVRSQQYEAARQHPVMDANVAAQYEKEVVAFVDSPDPEDRAAGIVCLRWIGGHENKIVAALGDAEPLVRHAAALAFLEMPYPDWIPAIAKLLTDPSPAARASAAYILGELRQVKYLAEVRPLLHDPDAEVRATARTAIHAMSGDYLRG